MDDVVPAAEILSTIDAVMPLRELPATYPGEVADRWAYADGDGEIGVIASVTHPFCADCSRARLTADGQLYTCLFAGVGRDLRGPLRAGASDADLTDVVSSAWRKRDDRYSELRSLATLPPGRELPIVDPNRVEMSRIGG
jgi:cyclic pyranopterin phosphate synthase